MVWTGWVGVLTLELPSRGELGSTRVDPYGDYLRQVKPHDEDLEIDKYLIILNFENGVGP